MPDSRLAGDMQETRGKLYRCSGGAAAVQRRGIGAYLSTVSPNWQVLMQPLSDMYTTIE